MIHAAGALLAMLLAVPSVQTGPLQGTWELTRIFRPGPAPATRAVPVDSTVYLRITLETHPGDWISGRLYRRYHGEPERSKVEGGPLGRTGRYIVGVELEKPASAKARTAAWLVGDTLRFGTSFVPDADSLELRRVGADAPYPATVTEVVTVP
ncbi:MAG TPA: hypothetical protein VEU74_00945 [Gemmatimonadales bacterium]|nr:hypothetical protein [Gemmatimonadales bacterium]